MPGVATTGADPNAELQSPDKTLDKSTPLHLAVRLGEPCRSATLLVAPR
jgi:hypothetical protein